EAADAADAGQRPLAQRGQLPERRRQRDDLPAPPPLPHRDAGGGGGLRRSRGGSGGEPFQSSEARGRMAVRPAGAAARAGGVGIRDRGAGTPAGGGGDGRMAGAGRAHGGPRGEGPPLRPARRPARRVRSRGAAGGGVRDPSRGGPRGCRGGAAPRHRRPPPLPGRPAARVCAGARSGPPDARGRHLDGPRSAPRVARAGPSRARSASFGAGAALSAPAGRAGPVRAGQRLRRVPPAARAGAGGRDGADPAPVGRAARQQVVVEPGGRAAERPGGRAWGHHRRVGGVRAGVRGVRGGVGPLARVGPLPGLRPILRAHRGTGKGARRRHGAGGAARPRVRRLPLRRGDRGPPRQPPLRRAVGGLRSAHGVRRRGGPGRGGGAPPPPRAGRPECPRV
ncbi:MAG: Uncharacterized MFS-type transporter, partial [uncultured Gemmatimonadetes bacterium]